MDGKVDATASGLQLATRVAETRSVEPAARASRSEPARGDLTPAGGAGTDAPSPNRIPSFKPTPEEIPPNWVFAPGFLHADRRGLVPYPGVALPDGMTATVLLRKYAELRAERTDQARQAYASAAVTRP